MAKTMKYLPVYVDERTGLSGWGPEAYEMIRQGYKCAKCWEEFDFFCAACPVCRHVVDFDLDFVSAPQHWLPDPSDDS